MSLFERHHLRFYRRTCAPVTLLTGDIGFHLVGAHDFPWAAHPMQEFLDQYRQRFASGVRAWIGMDGDRVAFSSWVEERRLHVDELHFTWNLAPPDAVVYDVVTTPEYRGRGIYPDALRRLSGRLAEEGLRHLWIYAEEGNESSLRGIAKADFEFRGSIRSSSVMGMTRRSGKVAGVNG